ncbi:hypothetical protein OEZ85_010536 [Tetradesmus obliquus]|uniref:Replication factor C subunit 1 n=1 Tax=Tetradesmus obliquus TaxID=3088 RepID=A0ABY8TMJ7_TETOB|nr:hypothetical protein OEZ85_010536 [Tetradesmus obliquus]
MDIRKFFQAAGVKPGAATQKKEKKQEASQPQAAAAAAAPAKAKPKSKSTPSPAKRSASKAAAGKAAAAAATPAASGGGSARKRKKKDADSDSDVVLVSDDDDDDDDDVMSLDAEDDASDDDDFVDLEDEDDDAAAKPKPAKRAKPSTPAATKSAGSTPGRKGAAAAAAPKGKAAGGRGKATKHEMVIEKGSQECSEKKRKVPGSMAGQAAPVAPKSAKKEKAEKAQLPPEAAAAVAAVDASAKALPELQPDELVFMKNEAFGGAVDMEPSAPGSKTVPAGHPDAFTGKVFVFSGVLPSLYREQATDLVAAHGGRSTKDVSGKSSFLVVGNNCSRRKFDKAIEKRCKVIDEDGFLALVGASKPPAAAAAAATQQQPSQGQQQQQQQGSAAAAAAAPSGGAGAGSGRGAAVKAVAAAGFYGTPAGAGSGGAAAAAAAGAGPRSSRAAAAQAPRGGTASEQLWVDKYKPRNAQELVGNPGLVSTIKQWLFQWDAVHLHGATPEQPSGGGGGKPKDMGKKAVLLSGPPGIGKTSSAHIIARELGFQVVEVNASDTRSKSDAKAGGGMAGKLSNVVREMVTSTALAAASGVKRRQVLVMDEVDGMSGGDRGGVADLIATIKMSRIPIICICNDKYSQKLRSLRSHCLELDYRKPTWQQISSRMSHVCRQEGLAVNEATLRTLIEGAQGDLRLILGQLQMARLRSQSLDFTAAKAMGAGGKDADMSPFSAAGKLLEARGAGRPPSVGELTELAFADADLVPLLVAENYVNHRPDIVPPGNLALRLRALAKAADAISAGDVVNVSVRRYGNWGLMPFGALLGCVVPAAYMHGPRETFEMYENNFTRFSAWFGNNSHQGKQKRLLAELSCNMAAAESGATCSRGSVRLDYLPALRTVLTRPLVADGEEAIPRVISAMQDYCINREQWDFVLDITKCKSKAPWAADPTEGLGSKVKSAFTRKFNQQGLVPRTNTMVADIVKGRKGKAKAGKAAAGNGGGEGDELAGEGLAGDAEGGAALAEEAGVPGDVQVKSEEEDEDELSPEQLADRMKGEGIKFELKAPAASGKAGGPSGRGRGGGRSGRGGSGRGGAASGGRGPASGRGRGRGRGK